MNSEDFWAKNLFSIMKRDEIMRQLDKIMHQSIRSIPECPSFKMDVIDYEKMFLRPLLAEFILKTTAECIKDYDFLRLKNECNKHSVLICYHQENDLNHYLAQLNGEEFELAKAVHGAGVEDDTELHDKFLHEIIYKKETTGVGGKWERKFEEIIEPIELPPNTTIIIFGCF